MQNDTPGDDTIRSLVPLQTGALHFLARKDAKIGSLGELEGKKVGVGLATSGSHRLVTELLRHFEVDLNRIDLQPLTIEEACHQLRDGKIDDVAKRIPTGLFQAVTQSRIAKRRRAYRGPQMGISRDNKAHNVAFLNGGLTR